ncbi:hypothetical protein TRICI_003389 [Trichomonascus ciferrii]|uniref:phosphoserine transaminase n=1 Tax=Trichomonascus ciferrii TaxID=44093 RepID=A0A642V442_9ASCO|nr:hypothetical protein TRICI_003389 [Trichomonascus ciferrii]
MTRKEEPQYFGAGPALLPTSVLEQAARDLLEYKDHGVGVAEISHRSKDAIAVIDGTKDKIRQLYGVPDTHEIFFAQGGGTGGFAAVAYNLLAAHAARTGRKGKADYLVTGSWSKKAAQEAARLGVDVNIVSDTTGRVPDADGLKYSLPEDTAYVYYCDNETVHGVEFPTPPSPPAGVELVADMSSNFLSRPVDVSRFGLVFGGAQKNIGIAGVSLYIIKKSLLEHAPDDVLRQLGVPLAPIFLHFPSIVANNSAYNTVSILAVQVVNLVLDHLLAKGGLVAQGDEAQAKADKVYSVLDRFPETYETLVEKTSRSRMNIVFKTPDDAAFLAGAEARGLTGLKGHRSVGGIRVSNYNAVSQNSIDALVSYMVEFANNK